MKFRKFKVRNHTVLGDCDFDFTINNESVDTIIIAGENGCGKTVLLNELYDFSNVSPITKDKHGVFEAEVELTESEVQTLNDNNEFHSFFPHGINSNIVNILHDHDARSTTLIKSVIGDKVYPNNILYNGILKSIYSDVEINFTPKSITSVTSKDIDQKLKTVKSSANLATEISQLLIDIKSLDDSELSDWVETHPEQVPPNDIKSKRMSRFKNAYNLMFESKRFKGVENINNNKAILFEENGKIMSIDKLSSGEKQIVFRGSFLLKDKNSTEGAYVLIDEPELSLHPTWQMKIVPFIKKLFTNVCGIQTSQIFIATHSPFIIHNSNRRNDKVIVLQKVDGKIEIVSTPEFYSWGEIEIVKEAFHLNLEFEPNKKYVFLEGETDEKYFNKALDVYNFDKSIIKIEWIGRRVDNNHNENTGKSALNNAAKFIKSTSVVRNNVYLLYDCDTNKPREDMQNLHIRCMTKNTENTRFKIGVENLLVLPQELDIESFYNLNEEISDYGEKKTLQILQKMALCDDICARADGELQSILSNIKKEIEAIMSEQ